MGLTENMITIDKALNTIIDLIKSGDGASSLRSKKTVEVPAAVPSTAIGDTMSVADTKMNQNQSSDDWVTISRNNQKQKKAGSNILRTILS